MSNKALLVGINDYEGAPLRGCINDIDNMSKFLTEECGFAFSDIRILTDRRATTKSITAHLKWLVMDVNSGDRLVFHYSGHGSQIATRDEKGVVSKLSDCICPCDFDFSDDHAITADEFMELFKDIPNDVVFVWVSDSCHSGDLARDKNYSTNCSVISIPRAYPMPIDIKWRLKTARELSLPTLEFARSIEHLQGAFISGCRSDQTSADAFIDGNYWGAATFSLLRELNNRDAWKSVALKDIVVRMRDYLKLNGYDQIPQVRGSEVEHPWLGA